MIKDMVSDETDVKLRIIRIAFALPYIRKTQGRSPCGQTLRQTAPLQIRRKQQLFPTRVQDGEIRMSRKAGIEVRIIGNKKAGKAKSFQPFGELLGIFFADYHRAAPYRQIGAPNKSAHSLASTAAMASLMFCTGRSRSPGNVRSSSRR